MEPISVMPCVYVLRLEGDDKFDDYYYAGSTHQLNIRIAQHIALCGAKFTKLHKFVSIYSAELVNGDALQRENELTLEIMNVFSSASTSCGSNPRFILHCHQLWILSEGKLQFCQEKRGGHPKKISLPWRGKCGRGAAARALCACCAAGCAKDCTGSPVRF